jgi:hypothetical protein
LNNKKLWLVHKGDNLQRDEKNLLLASITLYQKASRKDFKLEICFQILMDKIHRKFDGLI